MTDEVRGRFPLTWTRTPLIAIGLVSAGAAAIAGAAFSRPDVIAVGLPLALAAVWGLVVRPSAGELSLTLRARACDERTGGVVRGRLDVDVDADWVQLAVEQGERRTGLVDAAAGVDVLTTRAALRHSGPVELLSVRARVVDVDGCWATRLTPPATLEWNAVPRDPVLDALPTAPRLTGLHGAHDGSRLGQGGDFRDIHPFAPGDELRRVDWRATARAARRPGDLFVRRSDALSDSSVVIAVDTAEDLGEVVASWGSGDPERSGTTSLDRAREAALALSTSAIDGGDRVAYHALSRGGRSIRSGGGSRHLAHLRDAIAATGVGTEDARYRRSPVIPAGSIVFMLSTFFDGAAADLAMRWRASGHAVVAIDVLPAPLAERLTREQRIAMRMLLTERSEILAELRHAGIEVVVWNPDDVDAALRLVSLRQRRARGMRR